MTVRVNNTGGIVDETNNTGGVPVEVQFAQNEGRLESVEVKGKSKSPDSSMPTGTFAIEHRSTTVSLFDTITHAAGTQNLAADLITIGANGITAFVGVNGPYWTGHLNGNGVVDGIDSNGDGVISADESDELRTMLRSALPLATWTLPSPYCRRYSRYLLRRSPLLLINAAGLR